MIKRYLKKILLGVKCDSNSYIKYLRKSGCTIGENTVIYVPSKTYIDITRPYLIRIGSNVKITEGVTILTHGYDWSVLEQKYHEVLGSAGEIIIGDNVFIGMHSIILKGVHIGNNVIIGAGSLVTKDIPDNSVVGGNPAKIITTIDQYYKKRKAVQFEEAYSIYKYYRKRWGKKEVPKECFHEFFWLFECEIKKGKFAESVWQSMMKPENYEYYLNMKHQFSSYRSFIEYCEQRFENEIEPNESEGEYDS